jgi:hypothetical protein
MRLSDWIGAGPPPPPGNTWLSLLRQSEAAVCFFWTRAIDAEAAQPGSLGLEAGGGEHVEELALGAHVDGLGDELAFAVEDEGFGDAGDVEGVGYFAAGVEKDGVAERVGAEKG